MGYILVNFGPILSAALIGVGIGAAYAASMRRLPARKGGLALCFVALQAEFWLAAILAGALILAPNEAGRWVMALGSAVIIWIGFVLPTLIVGYGFRGQRPMAILGDLLHWLIVMVAQSAVMEAIGLVRP